MPRSRKSRSRTSIIAGLAVPSLRNFFWYSERTALDPRGPVFGPVDLQIAHHDVARFLVLKKDKRIWNKKARRVEHVGVAFAGGNEKNRLIAPELAELGSGNESFWFWAELLLASNMTGCRRAR